MADEPPMTLGQFRKLTENIPDETALLISEFDENEREWVRVPVIQAQTLSNAGGAHSVVVTADDDERAL